jgi:hypothetical protein
LYSSDIYIYNCRPEINIKPWAEEFRSIKLGAQAVKWKRKTKTAYWKGNPDVDSPIRMALLSCNDSKKWGAQIIRQVLKLYLNMLL